MKIQDMFLRDITREIDPVIKVDYTDKMNQELEEYVVTKEISKHLEKFYNNYSKGIDQDTNKVGGWVSGFFGSGKSHFLKILSYLLNNKVINGKKAVDYFENKIENPDLLNKMKRIGEVDTETILFNVDSKNGINNKGKEDAILRIFIKVFNEHRGLCDRLPGVANMESQLIKDGIYDDFKAEFEKIRGFKWEERRNGFFLDKKFVAEALSKVMNIPKENALEYIDKGVAEYEIDIATFSKEVKEYIDSKGENFHLVFLIDEVGQYIGDDFDLMLDMQTIIEDLGTYCKGKAWVVVTSQEKIDDVCAHIKGDDFSKIQGRFDTRLSMSSLSVDEVIKKRILEKKDNPLIQLRSLYREKSATLKNIINFEGARKDLLGYSDEDDFAEVYPCIPYQFKVLQSVFEQVRKHGNSGKHISEGERSMLSAFKDGLQVFGNREEGILLPFYTFYESIVEFLNPSITRVIERASENPYLKDDEFNVQLLKLLFMLKYLNDEVPANLENITTLMINNIEIDKIELRQKVLESLRKLQSQTLIQKSGEVYIFLTDDEQDVNRDIKEEKVEEPKVKKELADYIFKQIYDTKRYRFTVSDKIKYDKDFNKTMDEKEYGNRTYEMGINILSPLSDFYYKSDEELVIRSYENKEVIIKLKEGEYIEEIRHALKIESYINKKNINSLPTNIQKIIADKKDETRLRRNLCVSKLENAILEATFFINGEKVEIKGSSAKDKINKSLDSLCRSRYMNINYIKVKLNSETEIVTLLKNEVEQIGFNAVEEYSNELAEEEIYDFICLQEDNMQQVRMKVLINRFSLAPYGWDPLDIAGVVSKLLKQEKIKCKLNGEFLEVDEPNKVVDALTKTSEIDRVIINKKVKVDDRLVRTVKSICTQLFKGISFNDNEDEIVKEIRRNIYNKINEINTYLKLYEGRKYPGKSLFYKGIEIFQKIKENRENITFFNAIRDEEMDLLMWEQDVNYPMSFFDNQKEIFDKGLEMSKKCEDNKDYLSQEVKDSLEKLNKILTNSIPYKEVRLIMDIVLEIEEGLNKILNSKKDNANKIINEDFEVLKLRANQKGVSDNTKSRINEGYNSLLSNIGEINDIYKIDAKIAQSNSKRRYFEDVITKDIEEHERKIQEEIARRAVSEKKIPETKIVEKPKKQVEKIKVTKLLDIKSLKTESDVDIYVRELQRELKKIIRDNKEIEIEE